MLGRRLALRHPVLWQRRGLSSGNSALTPTQVYNARVAAKELKADSHQLKCVELLTSLHQRAADLDRSVRADVAGVGKGGSGGGLLSFFEGGGGGGSKAHSAPPHSQGLYLYGGVGAGKTMLMDIFFDCAPVQRKRRTHFHKFMLDVHSRVHEWRKNNSGDPLAPVGAAIAAESSLLCFDEFQVHDIADAMILKRLFQTIFDAGCMVVATSNRDPKDLYAGGLNRPLFLPFIDLLQARVKVHAIHPPGMSGPDYRTEMVTVDGLYSHPLGAQADFNIERLFSEWTTSMPKAATVPVMMGRALDVPVCADKVAWFKFDDLCARNLGAADYLALAKHFHTIVVEGVPKLTHLQVNEARRFITLVDVLYEDNIRLVVSAEAPPDALFAMNVEDYRVLDERGDTDSPLDLPSSPMEKDHLAYRSLDSMNDDILAKMDSDTKKYWSKPVEGSERLTAAERKAEEKAEAKRKKQQENGNASGKVVSAAEMGGVRDIVFAYGRAVSRLKEMQSKEYQLRHKKIHLKDEDATH